MPDELFLEIPSPNPFMTIRDEERTSISCLIFEPAVEEDSDIENTDWRRYDPPQELLRFRKGISPDLERILAPSVERIRARHVEEEERRATVSKIGRPLARVGRTSMKPRRRVSAPPKSTKCTSDIYVQLSATRSLDTIDLAPSPSLMTWSLDTAHLTPPSTLRAASRASPSSNISGYSSVSPSTEPFRSSILVRRGDFGALFKRKKRTSVNPDELVDYIPHKRSTEAPLPEPSTRQAQARESSTG
jgi:hypothetical protein